MTHLHQPSHRADCGGPAAALSSSGWIIIILQRFRADPPSNCLASWRPRDPEPLSEPLRERCLDNVLDHPALELPPAEQGEDAPDDVLDVGRYTRRWSLERDSDRPDYLTL